MLILRNFVFILDLNALRTNIDKSDIYDHIYEHHEDGKMREIKGITETRDEKSTIGSVCQQKYILLSTQRSGSTWVCSLLDLQGYITCGAPNSEGIKNTIHKKQSELLIRYSNKIDKNSVTWSSYKSDLDKAFERI